MAAADYFDSVQKIYIAFYSRPADPVGRDYWADVLNTNGGNLSTMIDSFATSSEATALYAGQGTNAKINAIYNALFGRDGDVAGITFYANEIAAGTMTIGAVGINILNGAQAGVDLDAVNAKVTYSTSFTAAIDTAAELVGYEGTTAAASARAELTTVVDAATLTTATANIDATLTTIADNPPGVAGSTFTLATTADTLNPTASGTSQTTTGDDTISGGSGRLGSDDSIDGGGGNDILNITVATGAAPIIANVETINLTTRGNATALDFTDISGVTTLNVSGTQSGTLGGLPATAHITVQSGFANNLALSLSDASGTADAITVIDNGASAFTLNVSGVETVNLEAAGTVLFGNTSNASQINLSGAGLNISGSGNVTLYFGTAGSMSTATSALSAINATALAGDLSVSLFALNKVTINAGTGNDTLNFGSGGLDTLDSINGGAGTDTVRTVIINGASTVRPTMTDVETMTFDGYATAATVDLRNATALSTLNVKATAGVNVTQMSDSITTINIQSAAAAPSATFTYATNSVSDVTVYVGTTGTAAAGITFGEMDFGGNTGALSVMSEGVSANVIGNITADAVGSFTLNASKDINADDVSVAAANSVSFVMSGGADISLSGAEFQGADSLTINGYGTGNFKMDTAEVSSGLDTVTINSEGDVGISAFRFTAASSIALTVDVTIGSGATARIDDMLFTGATHTAINVSYVLRGSGNVTLGFLTGLDGGETMTANVDAVSLGGALAINASASTGVAFNISMGNGSGNSATLGIGIDTVIGGATGDTIEGGGGNDELAGGGGADVFLYISSANQTSFDGIDVITDFGTADVIRLTNAGSAGLYFSTAFTAGFTAGGTAVYDALSAGTTTAGVLIFQRGSDVVVQVALETAAAATTGNYLEIILQGETLNTAFTATTAGISNLVIS